MATKDYKYIRNAIWYRFTRDHLPLEGSSPEYMPSVLALSADVIDLYYKNNNMQIKMKVVKCRGQSGCKEEQDCICDERVFYAYYEKHFHFMQKPQTMDEKLKIDNQYPIEDGNPEKEFYNKEIRNKAAHILAFRVLYRYYEVMSFDICYWHIDYYEDILASIFLFCPQILCYAIKEEQNELDKEDEANKAGKPDMHVVSAIQKCLEFAVRVDKRVEENVPKKKRVFCGNFLSEINNFHILTGVETALTDAVDQWNDINEVVKMVIDVCRNVIKETAKSVAEWPRQNKGRKLEKDLEILMGRDSYKYIHQKVLETFR